MAGNRAALRVGLIGGLVLGLAAAAQQATASSDLAMIGWIITVAGLSVVGYLAVREAGSPDRASAMRSGAVAGLVAGLIASLAAIAMMLMLSVSGDSAQRITEALREMYTSDQLKQLADMGATLDVLAQSYVILQITCCGAGLPIIGLMLGGMGGTMAFGRARGNGPDQKPEP
jgi:hypothetical protein